MKKNHFKYYALYFFIVFMFFGISLIFGNDMVLYMCGINPLDAVGRESVRFSGVLMVGLSTYFWFSKDSEVSKERPIIKAMIIQGILALSALVYGYFVGAYNINFLGGILSCTIGLIWGVKLLKESN